jgi:hypothetical protein
VREILRKCLYGRLKKKWDYYTTMELKKFGCNVGAL